METTTQERQGRRSIATVQQIRSPLTRVGYGIARGTAVLLLLVSGRIERREPGSRQAQSFEGPRLAWFPDGEAGELLAEAGCRGTLVFIPTLALTRALPVSTLGGQMRRALSQAISLPPGRSTAISTLIDGLGVERQEPQPGVDIAQDHYLALILIQLWRLVRADLVAHGRAPQGMAERFVILAGQHARDHWAVADYARVLNVSRDRLGSAVRRATGLSPQGFVHRLLIREASELLLNTGMPVSQVAFRLGFADAAYFNRFFTRQAKVSPGRFRRDAPQKAARDNLSFAAWP